MNIKINGKSEILNGALSLSELILSKALVPEHIVVEHNYNIISKENWDGVTLKG